MTRGKSPATNRNSADTRNVSKWKGQNACEKKNARNKPLVVSTRNIPPASNRGERAGNIPIKAGAGRIQYSVRALKSK